MFGKEENKDITAHLISLIIGKEVKEIDLDVNKRLLSNRINGKIGRLDVKAKFNNGEDCNIEMQYREYPYMEERMLYYWSALHSTKLSKGHTYGEILPTYSILITNYRRDKFKKRKEYCSKYILVNEAHREEILTHNIELYVCDLLKLPKNIEECKNDELALWLKFIKDSNNKEVHKMLENNKFWQQAKKELDYLSNDDSFKVLIDSRAQALMDMQAQGDFREKQGELKGKIEGKIEGKREGKKEGRKEGERKSKISIAKKLKEMKLSIQQIIEATGLTRAEIESLT